MPQHALRRKHHQRLAPLPQGLPPKQVEVLPCIRWLRDLDVIARGKLQVALDASAGMLRALTFVAMRQ